MRLGATNGFGPESRIPAGNVPNDVAVGEMDGDGFEDFVVSNVYPGEVVVHHGTGTGSFTAGLSHVVGRGARPLAVGRIDGDERDDVAVAQTPSAFVEGGGVEILLAGPGGTLGRGGRYATGTQPEAIAVADFDEDGRPDVATANLLSNDTSVLLNIGGGMLGPETRLAAGLQPIDIGSGNVDGDGHRDLIVVNRGSTNGQGPLGSVWTFRGRGNGTFDPALTSDPILRAEQLTGGDFTGDARDDIITSSFTDKQYLRLTSSPSGAPGTPSPIFFGRVAQCFATGDVDENGTLDLFTGSDQAMTADTLVMQRGYGDGTFFAAQFIQGAGAKQGSIALGDLNRDGHLDLAVSTFSGGFKVWLLLGNGAGGFPFATSWGTGLHPLADLAIGDFNSDDKLDVAVVDASADDIVILSGRGDGTLEPEVRFGAGGDLSEQLAVADFDQDGRPDIAVTAATTNDVRILLNEGNHRPVADAGADRVVETDANGYAVVALDGSGSVDADSSPGTRDDIQVFQWFNGLLNIANGEQASVTLASGPYTLALRVVDREDSRDLDDASVVVRDNCPGIPNPEQTDADLDGHGAACDCLDSDPAAWTSPSESSGLSLDRGAGETVILSWDDPSAQAGPGTVHDIVTGSLAALRAQGGFAGATCAASGVAAAPATIPLGDPATGDAAYMLVRGRNPCGSGSYGNGSGGERVVTACP